MADGYDIQQLIKYMRERRDHAISAESAVCESFDPWELIKIVAGLEALENEGPSAAVAETVEACAKVAASRPHHSGLEIAEAIRRIVG